MHRCVYLPEEVKNKKKKDILEQIDIPDEGINLEELEKEIIKMAVAKAGGKISMAAKLLNLSYDKLWFKVKRLRRGMDSDIDESKVVIF
jgi:transcriptional regulator with PAS, ATPase and Fis domain